MKLALLFFRADQDVAADIDIQSFSRTHADRRVEDIAVRGVDPIAAKHGERGFLAGGPEQPHVGEPRAPAAGAFPRICRAMFTWRSCGVRRRRSLGFCPLRRVAGTARVAIRTDRRVHGPHRIGSGDGRIGT